MSEEHCEQEEKMLNEERVEQLVPIVAEKFADLLLEELGAKTLRDVVVRNIHETNPDVCHSHDFCDANLAMQKALFEVAGLDAANGILENQLCVRLWNKAWDYAKLHEFNVRIPKGDPTIAGSVVTIHQQDKTSYACLGRDKNVTVTAAYWGRSPKFMWECCGTEEGYVEVRYDDEGKIVEVKVSSADIKIVRDESESEWERERMANPPCREGDMLFMPSGLTGKVIRLQDRYESLEELELYDHSYGILNRLDCYPGSEKRGGLFSSAEQAWRVNPLTVSTSSPSDFSVVPTKTS